MQCSELTVDRDGVALAHKVVPSQLIHEIHDELLGVAALLGVPASCRSSIDDAWNWLIASNRATAGLLYNAFKRLPAVHRLACSSPVLTALRQKAGMKIPMLVDVNCRIDSRDSDKYLFGWHQDYWFSICSTDAMVVWIPLVPIVPDTGGLDVISNLWTGGRLFETKPGDKYDSYADDVQLAEAIPEDKACRMLPQVGDALLFRFSVLHRSAPVISKDLSRFTVQLRFADAADTAFVKNCYKPGTVSKTQTDFLSAKRM